MPESAPHLGRPPLPALPLRCPLKDGRTCTIRAAVEDDARELLAFLKHTHAESDFLNYFPGEFTKTIEEERAFIRDHLTKPGLLLIVGELDGRIIAAGGAWSPEFQRMTHHAELGLTVLRDFWRQGIGRKLMECIIEWGRLAGKRKIYLRVFADNDRALPMYESLGFAEEGRLRGDVLRADGTYGDTVVMAKFYRDNR